MRLTNSDLAELTDWRRALHRLPELSGCEVETAATVAATLAPLNPDRILTGLGGHGVAAIFDSNTPGPSVMIRAELDALPIPEVTDVPHRSARPGIGHLCGHDGHMAILMGLARLMSRRRPAQGRAILLFQPAEEDGSGAAAVIADPRWTEIAPDWAFSLHNFPGIPLGHALLATGPVNCASCGMRIHLSGKTSHASVPEAGLSPAPAIAALMPGLTALGSGGPVTEDGYRLVTVTHARLGEAAFGIAPGEGEVWATLRTVRDDHMAALWAAATDLATQVAAASGLTLAITRHDDFAASINHPAATDHLRAAHLAAGLPAFDAALPMRASEDFGRFGAAGARAAMLYLGSGEAQPMLHNPDFDFPDALIDPGVRLFHRVVTDILG
jgi:amidohydrolase